MPQADEEFVDFVLNTISDDLRRLGHFSNGLLDSIDRQFNAAAEQVREALQTSPWVPEQIRPPPSAPPRGSALNSASTLERLQAWVHRNRALTAAILAFVGTGTLLIWRQRRWRRQKRRARRAVTGAKTEVVLLAGSPYSLLTQSLATDFERRGFLVFVPVSSVQEETAVFALRLSDVRPLNFDIASGESTEKMLEHFSAYLANPQRHGTTQLHLASLVIADADASAFPTGPIKNLPASLWLDSINSHIIYPLSLIHTFLPLLTGADEESKTSAKATASDLHSTIVVITESNTPSLTLSGHASESLTSAALTAYTRTLQAELPPSCRAVHVRLGAFDYESVKRDGKIPDPPLIRPNPSTRGQAWPSARCTRQTRELHLAMFDAMTGRSSGTVFVGAGARTYSLIGAVAPRNLVLWMTGQQSSKGLLERSWANRRQRSRSEVSSSGSDSAGRSIEWEKLSN